MRALNRNGLKLLAVVAGILFAASSTEAAQTDCADGNGVLDNAPPKRMSAEDLIHKLAAQENKVKEARNITATRKT